jgi:hypothetical protein
MVEHPVCGPCKLASSYFPTRDHKTASLKKKYKGDSKLKEISEASKRPEVLLGPLEEIDNGEPDSLIEFLSSK